MSILPDIVRPREPEAARDLIKNGHPRLGFALAMAWVLTSAISPILAVCGVTLVAKLFSTTEAIIHVEGKH